MFGNLLVSFFFPVALILEVEIVFPPSPIGSAETRGSSDVLKVLYLLELVSSSCPGPFAIWLPFSKFSKINLME